jgi:guanine deaminase
MRLDALWLRPPAGSPLDFGLRHADGPEEALARAFALGVSCDVAGVWVDSVRIKPDGIG